MQTYQDKVNKLASLLKERKYVVVLTGAGISTESGLPDFRSSGGLWDGEKPEEISHWSAVGTEKFKNFFSQRIKETESHSPNIAHKILATWQKEGKIKSIITQNIDGYHTKAGAYDVVEMHGHLRNL